MSALTLHGRDGAPLLTYRVPADAPAWRSNFIHPLRAPGGAVLTEDAPADHLHHRGLFWAWRRIFVGNEIVDSWTGDGFAYALRRSHASADEITAELDWLHTRHATLAFVRERISIKVADTERGHDVRIEIKLRALVPNVAIAGTDDAKGYGGPTVRFVRSELVRGASDGRPLAPRLGAVATGPAVDFSWSPPPQGFPRRVAIACDVDGRPWTAWVLRDQPGMQNCAFPGRAPHPIPADGDLTLLLTIRVDA